MRSRWSSSDARLAIERWGTAPGSNEDVALRVYSSRLIGAEPALVLHGGGNTSVKTTLADDLGTSVDVLCVKGSGWDLGQIEPAGLPAVRLDTLQALRGLESLSDEAMVNAARTRLLDAGAPNPSVETMLHAFLPHRFIDHSHADAILALADQADAERIAADVFGDTLAFVPYVMPGFALAKLAASVFEAHPDCEGLFLAQHGLFTFGDTAEEAYSRHIAAVTKAENAIASARSKASPRTPERAASSSAAPDVDYVSLAPVLRGRLFGERGCVLEHRSSPAIDAFVRDPSLRELCLRGPATPDHVIRTKRTPLVLDVPEDPGAWEATVVDALEAYRRDYVAYFEQQTHDRGLDRVMLDPEPRVILSPAVGLVTVGRTPKEARVSADLYEHTIEVITNAEAIGRYHALPTDDIFDMEYWSLEQAKLGARAPQPMAGQVVLVTGAAQGIGEATAQAFAAQGACLFVVDRDPRVHEVAASLGSTAASACADLTDAGRVAELFDACVRRFGGVDHVVSNAGTAPQAAMATCASAVLEDSLAVNLLAHQSVAACATRVLRQQGGGGSLLFNVSKAAFNPGAGFGPYAVAKAGLFALMKQYAIEGAPAGIRANAVNADRVRTGLLDAEDVERRAAARGLDTDAYFRSNLLGRETPASDVAQAFVHLANARSTTGGVLTVDGGNIAASPR